MSFLFIPQLYLFGNYLSKFFSAPDTEERSGCTTISVSIHQSKMKSYQVIISVKKNPGRTTAQLCRHFAN